MKEYRRIGDLVDLIDERNKDEKVKTLIGVSIDKCFIKSVANTIGTDLTKYQVIRKNDFACSLMQVSRDGKIPIACLKDYDEAIMSPAYYIFRIKNTEEILPDYMAMWFMRKELTYEWNKHGLKEGVQFATLTDIIYKTWAGKTAKEYKEYKGLCFFGR